MICKTRGIVLRYVRYRETSIIATIFTESFGTHAYIINNIRTAKGTAKIALYQPLTLLDLIVYHKPNQEVARIKEVKCLYAYQTLSADMYKTGIALFITEVLNKVLKEESNPVELFEFLQNSLITLDHLHEKANHFHLLFLIKLSHYLGFGISNKSELIQELLGNNIQANDLEVILQANSLDDLLTNFQQRKTLLDYCLQQYTLHVPGFNELKSIDVICELWK